ncbi:ornithine carbamoyltransferase [bacterium]|nr:ornithine carbamoyltransferase [candidate division CSSED10-310 bacterium]
MTIDLNSRHFLTLLDFTAEEIVFLLDLAGRLKEEKRRGVFRNRLAHKNIALLFEKPSTRTRCAFVTAAADEGAHPEYLGRDDIQLGKKETVADTARVLGRMFDGIQFRGFRHETVETLAEYAGVPVWNGLTDTFHPTQALADIMTMREAFGRLSDLSLAYVGDGRNNVANSLLVISAQLGIDFRIVAPRELHPAGGLMVRTEAMAERSGARITVTDVIDLGVAGADAIYTDVWVSMGEEDKITERIRLLSPYRVTGEMMAKTGKRDSIFLHCLPSFHNMDTKTSAAHPDIMEVTDEVFEGPRSRVFDQAENRLHTIKAVMVATIAGGA